MIKKSNRITAFQIFTIGIMLSNSLFVGMGIPIIAQICRENDWVIPFIAIILGILPVIIFCKLFSYKPELNIIEKNKKIFGNIIGQIINFIIFFLILAQVIIITWAMSDFASTKYLTETPTIFLCLLFIIPSLYAAVKGIETSARTIQVIFILNILIILTITTSLLQYVDFENLKPFFSHGIKPLFEGSFKFITYQLSPFLTLLIIPKDNIINNKKLNKFVILSFILGAFIMFIVFFFTLSVLGVNLLTMYRYPEYYVIKKVAIGNMLDNVENFLSIHWLLNMITCSIMGIYFIKQYFKNLFKIKSDKKTNVTISIFCLIIIYLSSTVFPLASEKFDFMRYKFPYFIGIPIIAVIFITFLVIFIRKKIEKKSRKNNV